MMLIILFLSLAMLITGAIIRKKNNDSDIKLAGTGLCYFGIIILLTDIVFIAYKYESLLSYIVFVIVIIAALALRLYAAFKV